MKVFIAEKLSQCGINSLKDSKHTVVEKFVNGDALTEALAKEQPQVLVVRSTKVTSAMMDAAPSIELIVRAGAGFDNIDVKGASRRCIYVANCPGKNSAAVAELAIGLMLSLDRQIPSNVIDARAGRWEKAKYSDAQGLKSKTLGLVGLGNIGKEVVKRAKGLEMNVVAWSRSLTPEIAISLGVTLLNSPLEVAAQSDIVSLHVAANADTKHLANKGFFEAMKPKSLFINTTRGNVVDESALRWALDNKGIRAGLDVFEGEPAAKSGDYQIEIAKHPSVYITHHIGASTDQAQDETAMEAARIINVFASTSVVDNCVNIQKTIPGTCLLTVRHLDKVGVLAAVLNELRRANYNVQQMENIVFQGSEAACARIRYLPEAYGSSPREGDVIRNIQGIEFVLSAYVTVEYDMGEPSNKKQKTQ